MLLSDVMRSRVETALGAYRQTALEEPIGTELSRSAGRLADAVHALLAQTAQEATEAEVRKLREVVAERTGTDESELHQVAVDGPDSAFFVGFFENVESRMRPVSGWHTQIGNVLQTWTPDARSYVIDRRAPHTLYLLMDDGRGGQWHDVATVGQEDRDA